MKVSYVTSYDARNIHNWSGTGYHIAKSLEDARANVDYIGNLQTTSENLGKTKQLAYRLLGKKYLRDREPSVAKNFALQAQKRINPDTDVILSPGTLPVAYLDTNKPKVIYTDATFAGIVNYYDYFKNVCPESIRKGNEIEQQALDTAALAIFSSDWAAQTAITHYNISSRKVKVVPFGANLVCNRTSEDIKCLIKERPTKKCILLFLAVDWRRKGGDIVLETAMQLNQIGLETEVRVVGIENIPVSPLPPFVKQYGFISKATTEGRTELDKIIGESHFLFVPSIAEAYGLAFCEANSFGLPVISTKTGGIQTVIHDNLNGRTFDLQSSVDDYVQYIFQLFKQKDQYQELCLSSFNEYELRLNWKVAGKSLINLFAEII